MAKVWLGLGSNLNDPPAQVRAALQQLSAWPGLQVSAQSRFYRSAPLGPSGQADYCNAVCGVSTALSPQDVLRALRQIEDRAGRNRSGPRWGPRVLDLDLLLYDDLVLDTPELKIPHSELHRRNFVLAPLTELASDLVIPGRGPVREILAQLGSEGLQLWPAPDDLLG